MANRPGGINIKEWLERLMKTVFAQRYAEQSKFVFEMYDVDEDGKIGTMDILKFCEAIPKASALGKELNILHTQIVDH